jgi:hypothetical protein
VLLSHATHAHVGSDYDHAVVGQESHQSKHSGLQVLLMSAQVQECDDLLSVVSDVRPCLVLGGALPLLFHLLLRLIEPHYLLADAGRPPVGCFVGEVEHFETGCSSAVVHDALGEHSDQRALSAVHIPDDSNPDIVLLPHLQRTLQAVHDILEMRLLFLLLLDSQLLVGVLNLLLLFLVLLRCLLPRIA